MKPHRRIAWGILWRSKNRLDGARTHLLGSPNHPCGLRLYPTRSEARTHIEENYGYIRTRKDLRDEPHGWRMPVPVRVEIAIKLKDPQ